MHRQVPAMGTVLKDKQRGCGDQLQAKMKSVWNGVDMIEGSCHSSIS